MNARKYNQDTKGSNAALARRVAEELDVDEESAELRKRLWLRIARHVVTEKDDIRAAINLMAQSDGLLKIEDILPFFPGFARIDDFKDEICNALDGYNQHITNLKEEMRQVRFTIPRIC